MKVFDYVEYWAQRTPDQIAIEDGTEAWSYARLRDEGRRLAHVLADLGVRDGDRVGVLAKNCVTWAAIYQGAFLAGAVPVPLNYRLHPREWIHQITDSGTTLLLAQTEYLEAITTILSELPGLPPPLAIDGDGIADVRGLMACAPATRLDRSIDEGHPLYIMYSSGTTGKPKGVLSSHRVLDNALTQLRMALGFEAGKRNLLVFPVFHVGGVVNMWAGFAVGMTIRLVVDFVPAECVRMLDEEAISIASFAPAMIQAMLVAVPDAGERRYDALERLLYGSSPIAEETLRQAMSVFRCEFLQAYGQTECNGVLTLLGPEEHRRALKGHPEILLSCGTAALGTEVRIVDAEDRDVPRGEVGEIATRGPQVMDGYWGLEQASADTLRGGWLHTGDAGCFDADGRLYIRDRIKDMIVSGAENIYPREIEDVLYQCPQIADAAVIGIPDEKWGETVMAVIVLREDAAMDAEQVIAWCRARIAGYKTPRAVQFVDALPRNAAGKVLKRELRHPHWAGLQRQVS